MAEKTPEIMHLRVLLKSFLETVRVKFPQARSTAPIAREQAAIAREHALMGVINKMGTNAAELQQQGIERDRIRDEREEAQARRRNARELECEEAEDRLRADRELATSKAFAEQSTGFHAHLAKLQAESDERQRKEAEKEAKTKAAAIQRKENDVKGKAFKKAEEEQRLESVEYEKRVYANLEIKKKVQADHEAQVEKDRIFEENLARTNAKDLREEEQRIAGERAAKIAADTKTASDKAAKVATDAKVAKRRANRVAADADKVAAEAEIKKEIDADWVDCGVTRDRLAAIINRAFPALPPRSRIIADPSYVKFIMANTDKDKIVIIETLQAAIDIDDVELKVAAIKRALKSAFELGKKAAEGMEMPSPHGALQFDIFSSEGEGDMPEAYHSAECPEEGFVDANSEHCSDSMFGQTDIDADEMNRRILDPGHRGCLPDHRELVTGCNNCIKITNQCSQRASWSLLTTLPQKSWRKQLTTERGAKPKASVISPVLPAMCLKSSVKRLSPR
jgi:hypothetical protein